MRQGAMAGLPKKRNRAPISGGRVVLTQFAHMSVAFQPHAGCVFLDDASSVASFTSSNDDNETYLHAIDNIWLHFYVLYVFLVIDIDRLMDSDLLYYWFCFFELALHCRCLLIGSVASKMGIQMNVQVSTIYEHYSIVLYIYIYIYIYIILYDDFQFNLINNQHTTSIISHIKTKYSYGYDGISSALFKIIINESTSSLTLIINQYLTSGIFPDKLKMGKIIPVYKKGNNKLINNY